MANVSAVERPEWVSENSLFSLRGVADVESGRRVENKKRDATVLSRF